MLASLSPPSAFCFAGSEHRHVADTSPCRLPTTTTTTRRRRRRATHVGAAELTALPPLYTTPPSADEGELHALCA